MKEGSKFFGTKVGDVVEVKPTGMEAKVKLTNSVNDNDLLYVIGGKEDSEQEVIYWTRDGEDERYIEIRVKKPVKVGDEVFVKKGKKENPHKKRPCCPKG
jgi:ribosomal protein S28E/S33